MTSPPLQETKALFCTNRNESQSRQLWQAIGRYVVEEDVKEAGP